MKINLYSRIECIEIAKTKRIKNGIPKEEIDRISTSELLHNLPNFVFTGAYFPVVHLQYDRDDNPIYDNLIGYNISINRYGTSYFIPKNFVNNINEKDRGDIEIINLHYKNS